jgi:hypothetical protein
MASWKLVFSDDFSPAPDIDRAKWESPHYTPENNQAYIPRTGFRNPTDFDGEIGLIPCMSDNGADLRFSTYNPLAQPAGDAFLGSEMHTVQKWGDGGETVKFEARVKCPDMPGGAVASVFSYALCTGRQVQNEIDFEFASNHWGPDGKQLFTNVFLCASGEGTAHEILSIPQDLLSWHTFSLIYTPGQSVEWLMDGNSIRKETASVPDWKSSGGMRLYFNFWGPARGWDWAYNEGLQPVASGPGDTWHYFVKHAAVYYAT